MRFLVLFFSAARALEGNQETKRQLIFTKIQVDSRWVLKMTERLESLSRTIYEPLCSLHEREDVDTQWTFCHSYQLTCGQFFLTVPITLDSPDSKSDLDESKEKADFVSNLEKTAL